MLYVVSTPFLLKCKTEKRRAPEIEGGTKKAKIFKTILLAHGRSEQRDQLIGKEQVALQAARAVQDPALPQPPRARSSSWAALNCRGWSPRQDGQAWSGSRECAVSFSLCISHLSPFIRREGGVGWRNKALQKKKQETTKEPQGQAPQNLSPGAAPYFFEFLQEPKVV